MGRSWQLFGVPYTSMREPGGIDEAIGVLRAVGLFETLEQLAVVDGGDLELEPPSGQRGASGLLNEAALAHLVTATRAAVRSALDRGRIPLLVGGDCPAFLGPLAALGETTPKPGLVMIDGHEDAWPPSVSPTGEASDSELGIALGIVGDRLPEPLGEMVPLIDLDAVALLGPRDAGELAAAGVPSLRDRVALFEDAREIIDRGADQSIASALDRIDSTRFWLHLDLDALRSQDLSAVDYPQPGGLDWPSLLALAGDAVADARFAGATVVIYNPRLDPSREGARRVTDFVVELVREPG